MWAAWEEKGTEQSCVWWGRPKRGGRGIVGRDSMERTRKRRDLKGAPAEASGG